MSIGAGPALLFAVSTATAEPVQTSWAAGGSVDRVAWLASVAWFGSKSRGVWVRRDLPHQLAAGLDVRVLATPLLLDGSGFEVGAQLGYRPVHRWYRPMVALSGGWSGGANFAWSDYHGEGWQEQSPVERADYRPWFAGVQVEPLTVQVRAVEASALTLEVSQMGWARVLRARVQLLRVGICW